MYSICIWYMCMHVYILINIIITIIGIISTISAYFSGLDTSQRRIEVGPAAVASGDRTADEQSMFQHT